jgi:hypothetical protein
MKIHAIAACACLAAALSASCATGFDPRSASRLEGGHFVLYHGQPDGAAQAFLEVLEEMRLEAIADLGIDQSCAGMAQVYLFGDAKSLRLYKWGLSGLFLPDYLIGGVDALTLYFTAYGGLPGYSLEEYRGILGHELYNLYLLRQNPGMPVMLFEGVADYHNRGIAPRELLRIDALPAVETLTTTDERAFHASGAANYASSFVAYLAGAFGRDAVRLLIRDGDYRRHTGHDPAALREGWRAWLEKYLAG